VDVSYSHEFLHKFSVLYLDSFLANIAVGVLLGALGLFVVLRRVVFLSAALSQVAGAGLALAFFIGALSAHIAVQPDPTGPTTPTRAGERLDQHQAEDQADREIEQFLEGPARTDGGAKKAPAAAPNKVVPPERVAEPAPGRGHEVLPHTPFAPLLWSLLLTLVVALLLSVGRERWRSTQESAVGLVFILASAASIILAQLAEKGAHEITELLFGTVIFIPPDQQQLIYGSAAVVLFLYALLFKDFLFVSFDPTAARASRFPVTLTNAVLFALIAYSIAICTRSVGAMPVFALSVLPPAAALQIHDRMAPAVITSAFLGGASAAGGYFLSGLLNLSAGPLIVLVGAVPVLVTWIGRKTMNWVVARRAR
jgi:ABC-type Mn2+/Zn2+ transport system permease subunit